MNTDAKYKIVKKISSSGPVSYWILYEKRTFLSISLWTKLDYWFTETQARRALKEYISLRTSSTTPPNVWYFDDEGNKIDAAVA